MAKTDSFYNKALEFQNKRKRINDEYEDAWKKLQRMKGSEYYSEESKTATAKRDEALKALKAEYRPALYSVLDEMQEANSERGMTAPTEEELRLVQLLKMKDNVTQSELDAAAKSLKNNITALSILSDLARKNGIARNYESYSAKRELSTKAAHELISALRSSVDDFLEHDTPHAARLYEKYRSGHYGTDPNAPAIPKRPLFQTKEECFAEVGRIDSDTMAAFSAALD